MVCDLETGICGESGENTFEMIDLNNHPKKINLYYVTDPICSHCWALEPVLGRFKATYGHYFKFQTIMGGLLESWEGFADVANGIGSPSDVAGHWREVGEYSRMPIDGTLWLENPVQSSYIPSRVFKIIQQKEEQLATTFLRRAREAVFALNKNIGDDLILIDLVNQMGLDGQTVVKEASLPSAQQLLDQDFAFARSLGVRGFPTIIMVNEENKGIKIVGSRPLESYVKGLEQILATDKLEEQPLPALEVLLEKEGLLFSREIEEMYNISQNEVNSFLNKELSPEKYDQKEILREIFIQKR